MLEKYRGIFLLALGCALPFSSQAENILEKIESTGKFTVGVKVNYKPFGFRDDQGKPAGLELDIVDKLTDRLSAKFGKPIEQEQVLVVGQNRLQFLQQGRIDFLIATMSDTPERRKLVQVIDPAYYAAGVTLLAAKDANIKHWEDIKGRNICTLQNAWYNKQYIDRYQFVAQPYAGLEEALQATLDKRCVAFLDEDAHAEATLLTQPDTWQAFEIPVPVQDPTPWVAAIRHDDPEFAKYLSETFAEWHKDGTLVELTRKWGLTPSAWLLEQQKAQAR